MTFPDEIRDVKFSRDSRNFILGLKNFQFYIYSDHCNVHCSPGYFFDYPTSTCK